ncbi:hypothetical protein PR003_g33785 [Phytophthora rubi]|uniref:SH2 domain-containing protein n=1 Tax=Phytophthora rubi TaxID=129364 RepID=A0A6A4AV30_9STRA|nr:hypothetical protein PR003_g33785 [Phytophthora rubi]
MIRSFTCTYAVLVWYPSSSVTASQLLLTGSSFIGCTCSRSFSATWTTRSPVFFFVCLCEPDNPRRQFNVRYQFRGRQTPRSLSELVHFYRRANLAAPSGLPRSM